MKKALSLILLLSMLLFTLASCSPRYKKGSQTVLLTIGDMEVTEEEFRYICMKNKIQMQKGDEHFFEDPNNKEYRLKELEKRIFEELRFCYAIEILAREYNTPLSKEDLKQVKKQIKENKAAYENEEDYYAHFEKYYMTENLFYHQAINYYLNRNLFYYWTAPQNGHVQLSDKQLLEDIEKHFFCAGQILLTGDTAKEDAEKIYIMLEHGEDFFLLAKEHSKDSQKSVRYFAEGEMQPFFEDTVKSLEIGRYSEIVESEMGCHIIYRSAIDWEYVNKNLDKFRDTDLVRLFNEMVEKKANSLEIVFKDEYKGLILE